LASAAIDIQQGNYWSAAFNGLCAVPIAGSFVKISVTIAKAANSVKIAKVIKLAVIGAARVKKKKTLYPVMNGPLHHICSNKNTISGNAWTNKFEPLFRKAYNDSDTPVKKLLDIPENKVYVVGHHGPHPDESHEYVFNKLSQSVEGLDGDDYKVALEAALKEASEEAQTVGSYLNKLLTTKRQ
jgi:A nuclease family of the HNH/ENDO VII superfamily with conserved AHH